MNNTSWTTADKTELLRSIVEHKDNLVGAHTDRVEQYLDYASLYTGYDIGGFKPGEFIDVPRGDGGLGASAGRDGPTPVFNVIRGAIDTLQSKICLHKPSPKVLTSGGTQGLQKKAETAEKYTVAVIQDQDVYSLGAQAERNAMLYGLGAIKVFNDMERVRLECIHPSQIIVDNQGCLNSGSPDQMMQVAYVPRSNLQAMFPKSKRLLEDTNTSYSINTIETPRDLLEVFEAWSLPFAGQPGRKVIFVENAVLYDGKWERDTFPFKFFKYSHGLMGFYGSGVAEILSARQKSIARQVRHIEESFRLIGRTVIFAHEGSVKKEQYATNENCVIIDIKPGAQLPVVQSPMPVNPQLIEKLYKDIESAYEEVGVSMLSATSQKPAGLNAGIALQTYLDVETVRFSQQVNNYYTGIAGLAEHIVLEAKNLPPEASLSFVGDHQFDVLTAGEVDFDKQRFNMSVYPASSMPLEPTGRMQFISNLVQMGMLEQDVAKQLMGLADLDKHMSLSVSPRQLMERACEDMLETGKYWKPEMMQSLDMCIAIAQLYWANAKLTGRPKSRYDLLERFVGEALEILHPPQPQLPEGPPPMGPEGPPPGQPPLPGMGGPLPPPGPPPEGPLEGPGMPPDMPVGPIEGLPLLPPQGPPQ